MPLGADEVPVVEAHAEIPVADPIPDDLSTLADVPVPVLDAPQDLAHHGLPNVPNIARSMGLVPSAVELFFTTFRPHYSLSYIHMTISQAQAEFVAARVSSINECFY